MVVAFGRSGVLSADSLFSSTVYGGSVVGSPWFKCSVAELLFQQSTMVFRGSLVFRSFLVYCLVELPSPNLLWDGFGLFVI